MNRNIRQTLLAPVVLLLAAALGMAGCTADDDFNRLPQGSIPLRVGDVTVAGMKPGTRAAGGNASTRAAVSETPATGYTGIRKSRFVDGDELNLTLSNDGGGTNTPVTATLTGGAWVLSEKAYVISGTTTIRATYAGTTVTAGIRPDALEADTYTLAGEKVTFSMKHAHAMIDITLPTGSVPAGVTITGITLAANNGTTDETLATVVEEETDGNHYRAIALPGTTASSGIVKSLTAVIGGQSYVATLAIPLTVEANKKYPISLTFKENKLTATIGTASTNWGVGGTIDGFPAGYTHVIRTPEDLAQFAKDVNDGVWTAVALQTADIDLSQLKPAADAGINPLTGTAYTYTATKDNWVSIGTSSTEFQGKYNGNGHTISNLKGNSGLFGHIQFAYLTGIHLRDISLTNATGNVGGLVNDPLNSCVTLCSATGSITSATTSDEVVIGGLIGEVGDGANGTDIIRCSADVDIDVTSATGTGCAGGFVGKIRGFIVGCMAAGNVESGTLFTGGFAGTNNYGVCLSCVATGNTIGITSAAFIYQASQGKFGACYATGTVSSTANFVNSITGTTFADCAYTGTQTNAVSGIKGDVAVADLYATVTSSNLTLANVKTLHWSVADGYTLTEVTNTTWYTTDIWKDNGTAAPTLDLAYEGWDGKYEGATPNLLEIGGQVAYYVAPVNAKNAAGQENMTWDEALTACPKNWHVPTKDEFVAMTGLPADDGYYDTNNAAIKAAFPAGGIYWSSSTADDSNAWYLGVLPSGNNSAGIKWNVKMRDGNVRCVRKK